MTTPTTVAALTELIHKDRNRLEQTIAVLTDAQQQEPKLEGGWSAKDAMAHIAWWERHAARLLLRGIGQEPSLDAGAALADGVPDDDNSTDVINERVFAFYRETPLDEVRDMFAGAHAELMATVQSLADDELSEDGPLAKAIERSPLELIAGNTYGHYGEHVDTIEAAFAEPR